jgi:hypothetical protein
MKIVPMLPVPCLSNLCVRACVCVCVCVLPAPLTLCHNVAALVVVVDIQWRPSHRV